MNGIVTREELKNKSIPYEAGYKNGCLDALNGVWLSLIGHNPASDYKRGYNDGQIFTRQKLRQGRR